MQAHIAFGIFTRFRAIGNQRFFQTYLPTENYFLVLQISFIFRTSEIRKHGSAIDVQCELHADDLNCI